MIRVEAVYEHLGEIDSATYVAGCLGEAAEDDVVRDVEIIGTVDGRFGIVNVRFQATVPAAHSVSQAADVITGVLHDALMTVEVAP